MAQHDYNIANAPGGTVRADINALAEAIASLNGATGAPSVTFAHMLWYDESTSTLKIRNSANSAWGLLGDALGFATTDTPQFAGINVGAAADTTITRKSAGVLQVETLELLSSATGQPLNASLTAIAAFGMTAFSGTLFGLTLSNSAGDTANDIDIAAGKAIDDTGAKLMSYAGGTKRLDAVWAVGSAQGGRDAVSIADGTWFVFLIMRSDTGVVDVLYSQSATAPTMPTNYDYKRRIGSIVRATTIYQFTQRGDDFTLTDPVQYTITNPSTSAVSYTLAPMPVGLIVKANLSVGLYDDTTGDAIQRVLFSELTQTDQTPSNDNNTLMIGGVSSVGDRMSHSNDLMLYTDISARVRYRGNNTTSDTELYVRVKGWTDTRGRVA